MRRARAELYATSTLAEVAAPTNGEPAALVKSLAIDHRHNGIHIDVTSGPFEQFGFVEDCAAIARRQNDSGHLFGVGN